MEEIISNIHFNNPIAERTNTRKHTEDVQRPTTLRRINESRNKIN